MGRTGLTPGTTEITEPTEKRGRITSDTAPGRLPRIRGRTCGLAFPVLPR
jgi:hypothetical protein